MSGWRRWAVGTAELDCIAMAVMPECLVVVVTKEHWVVDGSLVEWVERDEAGSSWNDALVENSSEPDTSDKVPAQCLAILE